MHLISTIISDVTLPLSGQLQICKSKLGTYTVLHCTLFCTISHCTNKNKLYSLLNQWKTIFSYGHDVVYIAFHVKFSEKKKCITMKNVICSYINILQKSHLKNMYHRSKVIEKNTKVTRWHALWIREQNIVTTKNIISSNKIDKIVISSMNDFYFVNGQKVKRWWRKTKLGRFEPPNNHFIGTPRRLIV